MTYLLLALAAAALYAYAGTPKGAQMLGTTKPSPPQGAANQFASVTDATQIYTTAMNAMDPKTFADAAARLRDIASGGGPQAGPAGYAYVQMNRLAQMSVLSTTFNAQPGETWRISMLISPAAAATGQVPTRDQYAKIMAASNATVKSYDYNPSNPLMPMLTTEVTYGQPAVIKVLTLPGVMMTNSVERLEADGVAVTPDTMYGRQMYIQKYPPESILAAH